MGVIMTKHSYDIQPFSLSLTTFLLCVLASSLCYAGDSLTVYSGRAERLIKPVLDAFQEKTGISVQMLTSGSTELLNRLQAEGKQTPADVFITNEAGTLERARELRLLRPIHLEEVERAIPPTISSS